MATAPKKSSKKLYHLQKGQTPILCWGPTMQWITADHAFLLDWLSATSFPQISLPRNFTNTSVSKREGAEYIAERQEKVSVPFFLIVHVLDWVAMEP